MGYGVTAGGLTARVARLGLLCAASAMAGVPSLLVTAARAAAAAAPDGRPLALSFASDFSRFGEDLHAGRIWRTAYGRQGDDGLDKRTLASNAEQQLYVDPAFGAKIGAPGLDPFQIRDGGLDIVAQPAQPDLAAKLGGARYVSGLITTQPSFAQRYGYFEARLRLPAGKGLWPAFWLLPADMTWPPEIDVMESIGDPQVAYMSTHSKAEPTFTQKVSLAGTGFHTFAVSWDAKSVIWYVDAREVARRPTPADMHKPMFLIANLAVGGAWPGSPDASTPFPARYSIAFIRAYRFV